MREPLVVARSTSSARPAITPEANSPAAVLLSGPSMPGVEPGGEGRAEREGELPRGYSVVVPVYRGRETVPLLVERVEGVLAQLGSPFEILLVNDGSPDDSWSVICDLATRHPALRGISLMRNYG